MYIAIDLEEFIFIATHENPLVLCNLLWLEQPFLDYCIIPIDNNVCAGFTTIDLKKLYLSYFQKECTYTDRLKIRAILYQACLDIETDTINLWELEYQCRKLEEGRSKPFYAYKAGSYLP